MKQDIKKNEPRERQAYVPASVKVINVTAQSAILSVSPNSTEQYEREDWA